MLDPDVAPGLPAFVMNPLMHDPALGGPPALPPYLLDMDQGALAGAECVVL